MHLKSIVAAATALVIGLSGANAADEVARAAKVMWTARLCSTYAELSGDADEQRRLFTLGYASGQRFVAAAAAGTITAEEASSIVPMAVGLLLAGPSEEFLLGRVFESAANQAYDDVVKHDASGTYLELKDWVSDDALRASIATNEYARKLRAVAMSEKLGNREIGQAWRHTSSGSFSRSGRERSISTPWTWPRRQVLVR